ncbi:MAG: flagellar basal body-associated FliL family protein [Pseudomonadota bacterium]|nr:flagellar basal body-associated FliL family protein [Pseudomonadota bacterium]
MADQETEDAPKKGGLVKVILMIVGAIAMLGGGFFGGQQFGGSRLSPSEEVLRLIEQSEMAEEGGEGEMDTGPKNKDMPDPDDVAPEFATHYHEFQEPITTNLKGSRRFLQVGLGMSTQYDKKVMDNVETHKLALRSDILATIGAFTEEQVEAEGGRDQLATAIKDTINRRLEEAEGFGGVENVFFKTFVLQ